VSGTPAGAATGNGPNVVYEGRDLEATAGLDNYNAWIVETFRPYLRGHAIEIGSGIGTFAGLLRPHVDRLDVVEPSPNLTPVLEARFADGASATVYSATLEAHVAAMDDACRDAVILVNVLEHIEDDRAALAELFRITRPGGTCCCSYRRFSSCSANSTASSGISGAIAEANSEPKSEMRDSRSDWPAISTSLEWRPGGS